VGLYTDFRSMNPTCPQPPAETDHERRFGGMARLYGPTALDTLQAARVAVAGIGGVGSWAAEALARCGVGHLTLIDLDHLAESNINRQIHALDATLGQAKVQAMAERIAQINPACQLTLHEDFVSADNVDSLLAGHDAVLDCTDDMSAKIAMVLMARRLRLPLVVCGGAGGKTSVLGLQFGDLADASQDALLSKLRQKLRREHGFAAGRMGSRSPRMGIKALWYPQAARLPQAWGGQAPQGLSCAGYGSMITVTATMGLAAAHAVIEPMLAGA
jgi:tRNA A37 threonylcarbamoyladenosine dehydratase